IYAPVLGDESGDTAQRAFDMFREGDATQVWWGANRYIAPPSPCWLVWDKRGETGIENTFADCELAWTNMTGPCRTYRQLWNGMIREGEHDKRLHPTQKPIGLAFWAFEKFGKA